MTVYGFNEKNIALVLKQVGVERLARVHGRERFSYDFSTERSGGAAILTVATVDADIAPLNSGTATSFPGGTKYDVYNATGDGPSSGVTLEAGMLIFSFKAKGYPEEIAYPLEFSECNVPQPLNMSPDV